MKTKKSRRKTKSEILEVVQETAEGLRKAGVMDTRTLREFERLAQRITESITKTIRAIDRTIAYCEASNERMDKMEITMEKKKKKPEVMKTKCLSAYDYFVRPAKPTAEVKKKLKGKIKI